jgi:hypothetical protein
MSLGGVIGANRLTALLVPGIRVGRVSVLLDPAGEFLLDARRRASEDKVFPAKKPRLVANDTPVDAVESVEPWRGLDMGSSVRRGFMAELSRDNYRRVFGGQEIEGQANGFDDRDQGPHGCRTALFVPRSRSGQRPFTPPFQPPRFKENVPSSWPCGRGLS